MGQWEWYVRLLDTNGDVVAGLVFGPTVATYNDEVPEPVQSPDFSKIFILMRSSDTAPKRSLQQTDIGIDEVLKGFEPADDRLAQAVIPLVQAHYATQD